MAEWVARGSSPRATEGRIADEMNFVGTPRIGVGRKGITKGIGNRARHMPGLIMEGGTIEIIKEEKPIFWMSRVSEQSVKGLRMQETRENIFHSQR